MGFDILNEDECWAAISHRDNTADEQFYYSVLTTGIFCRPSCPSKRPLRKNIRLYKTRKQAEDEGFRPCKRCKPNKPSLHQQHADMVSKSCRLIESTSSNLTLDTLAKASGLSPYHFHRVFKSQTGLTPKAYGTAFRAKKIRKKLSTSDSITQTIYDSGFNSNSRFYETADQILGMTPTVYKNAGKDTDIYFAVGESSLGPILVASTSKGICALSLGDNPRSLVNELQDQFPQARLKGADSHYENWVAKVIGMIESANLGLNLPLDIRGSAFQTRVWQALREIPVGTTVSYSDVAKKIGSPKSARAVAKACAANTIAIAIPCHRVVRSDGALSGYRWGVERKQVLLEREKHKQK